MRKILRNPKGSKDWLPDEVMKQEYVRKNLVKVFELWGYQPIQTPILINWNTLSLGSNKLSDIAFKLIGQHGEILALRADLTTPIARVTAERLQEKKLPFRFYYLGKVFRYHARHTTNERELYQIGIELIGAKEGLSDLECLQLLIDSLKKLQIKNYLVLVNHTCLWNELFKHFGNIAQELYKALSQKDFILFNAILEKSELSKVERLFWKELVHIRGNKEIVSRFQKIVKTLNGFNSNKIVKYFKTIFDVFENNVEIDCSLTSDIDYYTGIYFEVITSSFGKNIASGGRYDSLINQFGYNIPAIGFSFCLEDLILVLEKQGKTFSKFKLPKLISSKKNTKNIFNEIAGLHRQNKPATLELL